MLASLYNGNVHIWNIETQTLVKSFEVCDLPVRCARFVARKSWVVVGSDDMQVSLKITNFYYLVTNYVGCILQYLYSNQSIHILQVRVFNYNTLERVAAFEAHSDYLRSIAVHPTQPFILTSSDDMLIKLWNWDKNWACQQVYNHFFTKRINRKEDSKIYTSCIDKHYMNKIVCRYLKAIHIMSCKLLSIQKTIIHLRRRHQIEQSKFGSWDQQLLILHWKVSSHSTKVLVK